MVAFSPYHEAEGSHPSTMGGVGGKESTHATLPTTSDYKTSAGTPGNMTPDEPLSSAISTPISSFMSTSTSTSTYVSNPTSNTLSNDISPSPHSTPSSSASLSSQALSSDSGSPSQQIPTWAIPVIVIVGLVVLVFIASLAIFGIRERRRKNEIGGKDPSYARALYRAGVVATGLFIPIRIIKRCHRSRKNETQKPQEMYDSQVPAYGKLEEQNRQSEEIVATTSPVRSAEVVPSPARERGTSVVSSLSSSTRSQGRYERLDMPPSPMSEDGVYPWKSNDPSETASGNIEKREASTGPTERTRVETPLARRSDSLSEKRTIGG
ncbi:hypothetical protein F4814DRAFT_456302 [Daldinia grandis]|nr:hypothetical protein F4814DRAFT_456302 [Daldinia grandis]